MAFYHAGMRELQDRYDGCEIPDRLAKNRMRTAFNDEDRVRRSVTDVLSVDGIAGMPGAKRLIRVTAEHIFSNCPRYIPTMTLEEPSVYVPREGHTPPVPAWKKCPS